MPMPAGWRLFICPECGTEYESPTKGDLLGNCRRRGCQGLPVRKGAKR